MRNVDDLLPLRPVEFYVMVVLLEGAAHGYGIVQEVEERTNGKIRLVPGNLYPILRRLVDAGLLEEGVKPPRSAPWHKQRRYYSITAFGQRVVAEEARRLEALVRDVNVQRLLKPRMRS